MDNPSANSNPNPSISINGSLYEIVASFPVDGSMEFGVVVRVLRNVATEEVIVETERGGASDSVFHRIGNGGCTPVDRSAL